MSVYPDTTFYVALRFFDDTHHDSATSYYEDNIDQTFLWSPWHRIEVANTFRQLGKGPRPLLPQPDARAIIHRLESDVRLGYFLHMEADWRDVLRSAYEISGEHGFSNYCRSADLLHVAYAKELAAELFVSFDENQTSLAQAAGLKAAYLGG